ncbi:hypothetical protein [Actinomadura hibisca]|uniref:hypothetical protein n=1 Tax=Actinomadura hibisca TaxID=68565 RepID=UPI0012F82B1E|nr:hypothetical protein [Actinomadura hibisca]
MTPPQVFKVEETRPAKGKGKDEDGARGTALEFRPVLTWCPEVSKGLITLRPNGEVDTWYYRVSVQGQRATISHRELMAGDAWRERFRAPGLGFRTWREVLTNIVLDQAERLPLTLAVTRTGWHHVTDQPAVYVSADGRARPTGDAVELIGATAELETAAAPVQLPEGHSAADVLARVATSGGWAPLFGIAAGARSFGQTIRPVSAALVVWGDPNTGKTCTAVAGRLLALAPCWPPLPTAKMSEDTVTDIEAKVDFEADMPTLLDDLALTLDAPMLVQRDAVAKLERIIRAIGNGGQMRGRRKRDGITAQTQRHIRTIPVITAQSLPPQMQASLFRRAVVLRLVRGDAHWRWWEKVHKSGELAEVIGPGLRAIGDRIISRLAEADDPGAVLAEADTAGQTALSTHVDREVPGWADSETGMVGVVSMAGAMLGGLALAADAAGVERGPLLDAVAAPLARSLAVQADTMEDRRQATDDLKTAIGDIIRQGLVSRRAFLTGPDGTLGTAHLPGGLTAQAAGLREVGQDPHIGMVRFEGAGVAMHYVPAYGGIAVRPSALFDLARASGDSRAAGYTAKSIGSALKRAGALVPGSARPVKRVTIGGSQPWCLVIPESVIWPDLDGDADPGPDEEVPHGQDDGGPSGGEPEPEISPAVREPEPSNKQTPTSPVVQATPPAEFVNRVPAGETASAVTAQGRPVLAAGVTEQGITWIGSDWATQDDGGYDSLPELLAAIVQQMPKGGTVAIDASAAARLGYPGKPVNARPGGKPAAKSSGTPKARKECRAVIEAAGAGWQPSAAGIGAWTAWHGPSRPSVVIVVPEWIDPRAMRVSGAPYLRSDHDALTAAYLLARYREITGVPFVMTAGTSGTNMIRAALGPDRMRTGRRARRSALLKWDGEGTPAASIQERACVWDRPLAQLTEDERSRPNVVGFDVVCQFLSAMVMAVLPWDTLTNTGFVGFDASIPGYWQVSGPWQPYELLPDLTGRAGAPGPHLLSTPTVAHLLEHGMPEEMITDAWLPRLRRDKEGRDLPRGGRLLHGSPGVAELIRDGLMSIDPATPDADEAAVREVVKATFRETVGMLQRGTKFVHRPDWADAIIGTARTTLLRKVAKVGKETGMWPVRINHDCVYYAVDTTDPAAILPDGWKLPGPGQIPKLGQWTVKPENVMSMDCFLATDVHGDPRKV